MTDPEPPHPGPTQRFRGGIRSGPVGWHWSWPFGRLEFDRERLRITGPGLSVLAQRDQVRTVRVRSYLVSSRVTVVFEDGSESSVRFVTGEGGTVAQRLQEHGWPVALGGPGAPPRPRSWQPLLGIDPGEDPPTDRGESDEPDDR